MLGWSDQELCDVHDLVMLDLDGVVYVGGAAVPRAAESIATSRDRGMRPAFITNNASRTPDTVADHLTRLGVRADASDVVTSAQAAARVLGARLEAGARVVLLGADGLEQALLAEGLTPVGVEDDADAVVMNADFAHAMTSLVPDAARKRWTDKRIKSKSYSCSTFMLYLGIEGTLPEMSHHTIAFSADYQRNVAEIDAGKAPAEPTIYGQNASRTDPTLAPEGHSALYVLAPVGNLTGGEDWAALAPAYREKILDRVCRLAGRDIRPAIRTEIMFTPEDWRSKMAVYNGATFNLAHNLGQMLHYRPRNRFEDIDGVSLTGGGTHPGSGLPTIFESARIAAVPGDLSGRNVLEVGPGTGVITKAILDRGVAPENLYSVEFSQDFAAHVRRLFPKVNVIQGDAFNLNETLGDKRDLVFDAVVSGVPLLNFPVPQRIAYLEDLLSRIPLGRPVVQLTYGPRSPIPPGRGSYTVEHFDFVMRNIPPTRLWIYRRRSHA